MPVYEYECLKCGARFEEIRQFSDPPLKRHNGCGGKVKKLLSAPSFQFKGTGWYVTDYARKGSSSDGKKSEAEAKAKSDSAKAGSKTEKSESKSEKSESKTESKAEKSKS